MKIEGCKDTITPQYPSSNKKGKRLSDPIILRGVVESLHPFFEV